VPSNRPGIDAIVISTGSRLDELRRAASAEYRAYEWSPSCVYSGGTVCTSYPSPFGSLSDQFGVVGRLKQTGLRHCRAECCVSMYIPVAGKSAMILTKLIYVISKSHPIFMASTEQSRLPIRMCILCPSLWLTRTNILVRRASQHRTGPALLHLRHLFRPRRELRIQRRHLLTGHLLLTVQLPQMPPCRLAYLCQFSMLGDFCASLRLQSRAIIIC
jgi:hypothetical protein